MYLTFAVIALESGLFTEDISHLSLVAGVAMSKQTMGKTLLRNVIRHTDAHNKIQEEAEMWKMRDWETQLSCSKPLSDTDSMRGRMHCDQERDQTRGLSHSRQQVSEHDDREARYWTRKLYDFEANDPDRWGHSGFKELYPEEFESDDEKKSPTKKMGHHKKSRFAMEACLSKRSKKSSRKKKKKKKMKDEEKKRKKAKCSSSDDSSDDSSAAKDKHERKKTKNRHKNKKMDKNRVRDEDSGSEGREEEAQKERRSHRRKRRKADSHRGSESGPDSKKKRRKDWKAACEESSSFTD
ncbi:NKAP domain containing 1 isoform X1 [Betta splendens]|uniref:NKAP domain containing 1 isoform X1 n=2 Tax=Betta splendens TaxID=158456 RepID=A0A8M1HLM4_BETSP|nr:NKAP domain containing 1 isoform X1 [Betta splendens]